MECDSRNRDSAANDYALDHPTKGQALGALNLKSLRMTVSRSCFLTMAANRSVWAFTDPFHLKLTTVEQVRNGLRMFMLFSHIFH